MARKRADKRGVALLITLVILAILTVLLVSFVSMVSLDRGATKSYAQSLQAEQMALGGLDQILSQLRGEITDPALSSSYTVGTGDSARVLYIPRTSANAMPERTVTALPGVQTLLSYSGLKLYTGGAGAIDYSSASGADGKSLNGRSILADRWNKPQLATDVTAFPIPKWVLMTRAGPRAFPTFDPALANGATDNEKFAVGRFAYTIYDTSGLLDANVAGYPASAQTSAAAKGLLPWADLTQLGSGITQANIDDLVKWRNSGSLATYAATTSKAAAENGFTRVENGDTTFLGRQELIKYVQAQNPALAGALPFLTTFSREVNGPTWGPSTPSGGSIAYENLQYGGNPGDIVLNPRIPNPRVKVAFTRTNGLPAAVNEPLVKYRFPLDKLALLEKFNGAGTLTAQDVTDIQKYFGLDLAPDSVDASFRHWKYPTASRPLYEDSTDILSLDQVATLGRDADFFELLQAGVLSGSLGVPGKTSSDTPNPGRGDQRPATTNGLPNFIDPDDKSTLQVLRIGANIIDQWDADSFPTTITLTSPETSVYGIEDLPYPFAAFLNLYGAPPTPPLSSPQLPYKFFLYFELWNPHQTPAVAMAGYPQRFRLSPLYSSERPTDSDSFWAAFTKSTPKKAPGVGNVSPYWYVNGTSQTSATRFFGATGQEQRIEFPATFSDYREPHLIPSATATVTGVSETAPPPIDSVAYFAPPAVTAYPTLGLPSQGGATGYPFPANPETYTWSFQMVLQFVMPLQYRDNSGAWRTYSTFIGIDDTTGTPFYVGTGFLLNGQRAPVSTASLDALCLVKPDPRTFRLGAAGYYGNSSSPPNANKALANADGSMNYPINAVMPFGVPQPLSYTTPYRIDQWAVNDSAVPMVGARWTSAPYYADIDGIKRWGDARNSYQLHQTSPVVAGTQPNRPALLNRPFTSVGDLGYVFRDAAWKTLDFFSPASADSGLLDLFTLSSAPIVAGRVNPNSPYPQVLAAMIAGARLNQGGSTASGSNALTLAQAIRTTSSATPFVNRADLVNRFMANPAINNFAPTGIKTESESVVRSLAESANTRTWNFLVDIIGQSGRFPPGAKSLDNFNVEAERRFWLHVAIDRYTGEIVDRQLEIVNQ